MTDGETAEAEAPATIEADSDAAVSALRAKPLPRRLKPSPLSSEPTPAFRRVHAAAPLKLKETA